MQFVPLRRCFFLLYDVKFLFLHHLFLSFSPRRDFSANHEMKEKRKVSHGFQQQLSLDQDAERRSLKGLSPFLLLLSFLLFFLYRVCICMHRGRRRRGNGGKRVELINLPRQQQRERERITSFFMVKNFRLSLSWRCCCCCCENARQQVLHFTKAASASTRGTFKWRNIFVQCQQVSFSPSLSLGRLSS